MSFRRMALILMAAVASYAQQFDYDGPSILSRGPGHLGRVGTESMGFQAFAGVNYGYDTGLFGFGTDAAGNLTTARGPFIEGNIGVMGSRNFRLSSLGLSYRGDYANYKATKWNNSNQLLGIEYFRQASKRVTLTLNGSAGVSSRTVGAWQSFMVQDPGMVSIPAAELFNTPSYFASASGGIVFQKSTRLSFRVSGTAATARRRPVGLVDTNQFLGSADTAYRISRTSTIGASFTQGHFSFSNDFGHTNYSTAGVHYARMIARRWNFAISGSLTRIETLGLSRVSVDPIVALLLGVSSGVEVVNAINKFPGGSISLTRSFRRSNFGIEANRGISPGNGVFLTSMQTSGSASYSIILDRWNFGGNAGYGQWSSVGRAYGTLKSFLAGAGVSRPIGFGTHFTARYDTRWYETTQRFQRTGYRVSIGLAFASTERPLALW